MILVVIQTLKNNKKEAMIYDGIYRPFSVVIGFYSLDEALEYINNTNK